MFSKNGQKLVPFLLAGGVLLSAFLASAQQERVEPSGPSGAVSGPAASTQSGVNAGGGQELQKVTVTGYVVPRIGEGAQPVITLDQDFFNRQGDQTVSDVLQRLPQNNQSFTPLVNAGESFSPGASTVNLYGIGVSSTLVLIDGKRQTIYPFPQNGFQAFVDLNSIPFAAVDRIEVLKDGASAVYGSDAIAGVVNVILKNDYNGADLRSYYGISQRGDDETYHAQLTAGISHAFNDHSTFNVLAAFDYYQNSPIDATDRWYSNNLNHAARGPDDLTDLRSTRAPAGNFTGLTTGNTYAVIPGTVGPNVSLTDFAISPPNSTNPTLNLYQAVPGSQLLPRETRYGGVLKLTYQPLQYLQLYDELSYQRIEERSSDTAAPVISTDSVITPASNIFNPTGEDLLTELRLLEFGQRKEDTTVDNVRNVAGLRLINLPKNWFVDASFVYAESDGENRFTNYASRSRLNQALAGTLPGFEGVYFNPFIDQSVVNGPNRQFGNALKVSPDEHARTGLVQWSISAGGELIDLPAGPITAGVGAEYRSNEYIDYKDASTRAGDVVGIGGAQGNASGKDYVRAAYGELTVPILGGQWSVPGARALELVASERYDSYSSFGEAWKPKFSIRYKPFEDLTFRASYAEGFRAPSVSELFGTPIVSFPVLVDPVTGAFIQPQTVIQGNPKLRPETAYSYYAGMVWSPGSHDPEGSWWRWANGFTAYLDWVEILKRNVINQVQPQFVLNNPDLFPGAVTRDQFGNVLSVADPYENLGAVRVDALDFGASYSSKEYSWGKVDLGVDATYYYHVSQQNTPGGQVLNVTNSITPLFAVSPDFKLVASIFYSKKVFGTDRFQMGFTLNYFDSEHDFPDFQALGQTLPEFVASSGHTQVHTIGSWTTVDFQISYTWGKPEEVTPETARPGYDQDGKRIPGEKAISPPPATSARGWRQWLGNSKLTFGINNLGDTRPPFADAYFQGYDTQTANPIQRYFYFEIEKKF